MSSSSSYFGNDRAVRRPRGEARDRRSDDLPDLTSRLPFQHNSTPQPPQAAANLNRPTPASEPTGQESHWPFLNYFDPTALPQNRFSFDNDVDTRRASDLSDRTLYDRTEEEMQQSLNRLSFSSYQHPNDIPPPRSMYFAAPMRSGARHRYDPRASLEDRYLSERHGEGATSPNDFGGETPRHRGVVSNLLELSHISDSTLPWDDYGFAPSRRGSLGEPRALAEGDSRPSLTRWYSLPGYDPDDPKVTGATRESLDDPADLERNVKEQMDLRSMSYKQRRKEAQKIKIRFFVTCVSELLVFF